MSPRERIKFYSEKYHLFIHIALGAMVGYIFSLFEKNFSLYLVLIGIFGNLFPDIDHFLSFFVYARNTDYSTTARKYLLELKWRTWAKFCLKNHKSNHQIITHNLISVVLVLLLSVISIFVFEDLWMGTLFVSWSVHYFFDLFEDYIFFKKINPNWFFNFEKTQLPTQ